MNSLTKVYNARGKYTAGACVLLLLYSCPAWAADVLIRPKISAILNQDFSPTDPSVVVSLDPFESVELRPRAEPYVVQIDAYLWIDGLLSGEEGFGNIAFNMELDGSLELDPLLPGWQPDASLVDMNGDEFGGLVAKWADNGDYGPSGLDLLSIVVGSAPREFGEVGVDPRRTLGQGPDGEYLGSLYVDIAGQRADGDVRVIATGASTYDATGFLSRSQGFLGGDSVAIIVPEPASALLLALAAAWTLCARFRTRRHHGDSSSAGSVK